MRLHAVRLVFYSSASRRALPIIFAFGFGVLLLTTGTGCDSIGGDASRPDPDVVAVLSVEDFVDEFGNPELKVSIRNTGEKMLGAVSLKFWLFQNDDLVARTGFVGVSPFLSGEERTITLDLRTPGGKLISDAPPPFYSCYSYAVTATYESAGENVAREDYTGTCE